MHAVVELLRYFGEDDMWVTTRGCSATESGSETTSTATLRKEAACVFPKHTHKTKIHHKNTRQTGYDNTVFSRVIFSIDSCGPYICIASSKSTNQSLLIVMPGMIL